MKFDYDDPRLTAYLLGELGDAERTELEKLLASDAAARSYVETLRETAEALEAELGGGWGEDAPDGLDYGPGTGTVGACFVSAASQPQSRVSSDGGTASYTQMRRLVRALSLPPGTSVRIEEYLNYFDYEYPEPIRDEPFGVVTEVAEAPWNRGHKLVRIGVKAPTTKANRSPANLVFLWDVSKSMNNRDKLRLLKTSLATLVESLGSEDRIAIVVYASEEGGATSATVALPPIAATAQGVIFEALERLRVGGNARAPGNGASGNGASGVQLAYQLAQKSFVVGGVNRVVLATDGDLNVGGGSREALTQLIAKNAESELFLSVLGVGLANFDGEASMKELSAAGHGTYAYIDSLAEARKVLDTHIRGPLVPAAKDVTIEIEFNPERVAQYRLLGTEVWEGDPAPTDAVVEDVAEGSTEHVAEDVVGARDIRAGQAVTALYEVIPKVRGEKGPLLTLKVRYTLPTGEKSQLMSYPVADAEGDFASASADFKFASAVVGFGMLLRGSPYKGKTTFNAVLRWARQGRGADEHGDRNEFIELVRRAQGLRPRLKPEFLR